jgi:hypothetical protein
MKSNERPARGARYTNNRPEDSAEAAVLARLEVLTWCRSTASQELRRAALAVERDGWGELWAAAWRLGGIALVGLILAAEVAGDLEAAEQLGRTVRDRNQAA